MWYVLENSANPHEYRHVQVSSAWELREEKTKFAADTGISGEAVIANKLRLVNGRLVV